MSAIDDLLCLGRPLLADGAVATNLIAQGLPLGMPPELWNISEAAQVESLHCAYVDAGAEIILTNRFGANRHRPSLCGAEGHVCELNRHGARFARRAADRAGHPVLVAGSVGPTGVAAGTLTEDDAERVLAEQIEVLAKGGVDVIWIETQSSAAEMRAAAHAAAASGLPYALSASPHHGSTLDPATLVALVRPLSPGRFAVGYDYGAGSADLLPLLALHRTMLPGTALVAKPNAGLPVLRGTLCGAGYTFRCSDPGRLLRNHARSHHGNAPSHAKIAVLRLVIARQGR